MPGLHAGDSIMKAEIRESGCVGTTNYQWKIFFFAE